MRLNRLAAFLLATVCLSGTLAQAVPLPPAAQYIKITGDAGDGTIGATPFTAQPWAIEYQVEPSTPDSDPSAGIGTFSGALLGGTIKIGSAVYQLSGTSNSGTLGTSDVSKLGYDGDGLIFNPGSGGFVQFQVGDDQIFPSLWTDNNSLTTVVPGSPTLISNTTDSFNNSSMVRFAVSKVGPIFLQYDHRLQTTSGALIALSQGDSPAGGHFTLSVSTVPTQAVPEPSAFILGGLGLIGVLAAARRRQRRA
jgi:MYXO-CTERM domain-containing protein